jgi:hypothetical protein
MTALKPATSLLRLKSHWLRTGHAVRHVTDRAANSDAISEDDLYVKKVRSSTSVS